MFEEQVRLSPRAGLLDLFGNPGLSCTNLCLFQHDPGAGLNTSIFKLHSPVLMAHGIDAASSSRAQQTPSLTIQKIDKCHLHESTASDVFHTPGSTVRATLKLDYFANFADKCEIPCFGSSARLDVEESGLGAHKGPLG